MERLAEIVVGPGLESVDALMPGIARGEHQHRCRHTAHAPIAQHRQSGPPGESEIENDGVVGFACAERLARDPVGGMIEDKA